MSPLPSSRPAGSEVDLAPAADSDLEARDTLSPLATLAKRSPRLPLSPPGALPNDSGRSDRGPKKGLREEYAALEHHMSLAELATAFGTHINEEDILQSQGLSGKEALFRLARDGPNILTPPAVTPEIVKFLLQFCGGLMLLLGAR